MKTLIKILTITVVIAVLSSCSNNNNDKTETKEDYKEHIRNSVTTFITKNIEQLQKDEEETVSMDTIEIIQIDTLTDKSILISKQNLLLQEIERNRKIRELEIEKFNLNKELGVYENETLKELARKDIEEMLEESRKEKAKLDSLTNLLKNNPDSLTFRYYLVTAKITGTEEDLTQRTVEVPVIVTRDYKIKRFEDL